MCEFTIKCAQQMRKYSMFTFDMLVISYYCKCFWGE